ncbi:MAG TPA: hypothetical protein VFQ53_09840 [Kofleriaceae bacterium]|nr:hypothetical protein [Kofleriaceae bacterium]
MRLAVLTSQLALTSLVAVGCSSGLEDQSPTDDPVGTPENPVPSKTGPYEVRNTVDFTVEAVLPPQIELVVATLREFSTNPAHALITIADQAGVPAVGTLYGLIPGIIKDRLEGWINDEIMKIQINGKPITEYAGDIAELATIALTQFAVDSSLDIHSDTATHRLTALDLHPAGIDLRVPIGGLAGDVLTQEPTITVAEGGTLFLGEQHFGLNYGEYAWQGVEAASQHLFGGGVREVLGRAINCPAIAKTVSDKCVLSVCVGHETELRSICEGGLDGIVNFAHDRLAAMRLEALHLATGDARLVDDDGDGVGDRIVDGTWKAELNLGLGLRYAPASFEGAR